MKIASWNVNSLRVRLEHVSDWLDQQKPDVLGLQELKMPTEAFPTEEIKAKGYHSIALGQKTYNGVALLSLKPPENIIEGIPGFEDEQRRAIAASYGDIRVINLYVPNGQSVGSDKYEYKLRWLDALQKWLTDEANTYSNVVVMGDFNIAPDDRDVHDPEEWAGKVLCSDKERAALQAIEALGFQDSFRLFDQPEQTFSWWDYRAAGFRRNRGLRIDLVLASTELAKRCNASEIDPEPRKLERPSDHAPAFACFD
ncbi:MAG: exodeoxyribonuclease III [Gammaproteobacteria bacterium]|nr:exodeoxyribonuclease III [Gammaproteobacteria bacterium]